jgi:hypothetical protein
MRRGNRPADQIAVSVSVRHDRGVARAANLEFPVRRCMAEVLPAEPGKRRKPTYGESKHRTPG